MSLTLDFWQLVGFLGTLVGAAFLIGRMFFSQVELRIADQIGALRTIIEDHARREEKRLARLDDITAEQRDQGARLARLEAEIDHAITHEDVGGLRGGIGDIGRQVSMLMGRLEGMESTLRIIQARFTEKKGID